MPPYEYEAHKPIIICRRFPALRCAWGGLVYLKNEPSIRAIKLGCNYRDHADWKKFWGKSS